MTPWFRSRQLWTGLTIVAVIAVLLPELGPVPSAAASGAESPDAIQLEHLDRGLVAAATPEGVFLSWRLLGDEVTGSTATGMAGADFHVYRDSALIATVTDSTN